MRHVLPNLLPLLALVPLTACADSHANPSGQDGAGAQEHDEAPEITKAVARIHSVGDNDVTGIVRFEKTDEGIHVTGEIRGLTPGDHGFHVHEFGDLEDMDEGKSLGGHFSPEGHDHGRPSDDVRHAGDLGNVTADEDGVATIDVTDSVIRLNGAHSIVGRGLVVHGDADDFGQPTGNAGPRVGVGAIGIAQD